MNRPSDDDSPLTALHRAAILCAATDALAAGVDTPTLRVLAGSTRAMPEEEARDLAPDVFDELGFDVPRRLSPEAVVEWARWKARDYLTVGGSPKVLARDIYVAWCNSGYQSELDEWISLDDYYVLLDDGITMGRYQDIDQSVREAAERLARPDEPI